MFLSPSNPGVWDNSCKVKHDANTLCTSHILTEATSQDHDLLVVLLVVCYGNLEMTKVIYYLRDGSLGAWVAQLVKYLTLDLSSDVDLRVGSSSPVLGSTEPVWSLQKKRWIINLSSGILTRVENKDSCVLLHKCLETEFSRFLRANWYLVDPWKVFGNFAFLKWLGHFQRY